MCPTTEERRPAPGAVPPSQHRTTQPKARVVVMNQDGSSGVEAAADVGATVPILPRTVRWLVFSSVVSGAGGLTFLMLPAILRHRRVGRR